MTQRGRSAKCLFFFLFLSVLLPLYIYCVSPSTESVVVPQSASMKSPPYAVRNRQLIAPPVAISDRQAGKPAVHVFGELYEQLLTRETFDHTVSYVLYRNQKKTFIPASSLRAKTLSFIIPTVFDLIINQKEPAKARHLNYEKAESFGNKTDCLYKMMDILCNIFNFNLFADMRIEKEPKAAFYTNTTSYKFTYLVGNSEPVLPVMLRERLLLVILEKETIRLASGLERVGYEKPYIILVPKGTASNYVKDFAETIAKRFVSSVVFIGDKDPDGLDSYMQHRQRTANITYIRINNESLLDTQLPKVTGRQDAMLSRIIFSSDYPQFIKDIAAEIKNSQRVTHLDKHFELSERLAELLSETDFTQCEGGFCELVI